MPEPTPSPAPRVGLLVPPDWFALPFGRRLRLVAAAAGSLDHLAVADHVSFLTGRGFDGLAHAAALLTMQPDVPVHTAVYQLPLRHPVTVARAVATVAELAPGRLWFGVGIGGDDRHE